MSVETYSIELPQSAFSALKKSPEEFIQEMKYAAAIKWYETGMISQNKAAEIAGVSRYTFITLLARYDVSAIQYTSDLLDQELDHVREENRS